MLTIQYKDLNTALDCFVVDLSLMYCSWCKYTILSNLKLNKVHYDLLLIWKKQPKKH